ncbi:unnamed protein product, partial [Laminaria digitata]
TLEEEGVYVEHYQAFHEVGNHSLPHGRKPLARRNPLLSQPNKVSTMVSEALRERLLPFVNREYGNQGAVTLEEEGVYVEHYQAFHEVG